MSVLEARDLVVEFRQRGGGTLRAVDHVSFALEKGETLALVGESGSGKSTLAQIMVRLIEPTSGELRFRGEDVQGLNSAGAKAFRHGVQMVFQDTGSSLNPRKRVGRTVTEALATHGAPTA
jgi:ABC-type glutathione transport system ATPase component